MQERHWVQILIQGAPLGDDLDVEIRSAEVTLVTNAPARATVILSDPLLRTLSTFSLGKQVEIRFGDGRGQVPKVFSGDIVEVTIDEAHHRPSEVVVEALDRSHRLALATSVHTYQKQTADEIIKKIGQEAGITVDCPRLGDAAPYFLLATSAHQVVTQLVTRHGHAWRWDMGKDHLVVEPVPGEATRDGLALTFGETLYRLQAGQSARYVHEAQVKGWDPERSQTFVGQATGEGPRNDLVGGGRTWAGESKVLVSGQPVIDQAEAAALAKSLVTAAQRRSVTVRGEAVLLPDLKPNAWVTVAQATAPGRRSYFVDRVVHRYAPGRTHTLSTHFDGGNHPYAGPAATDATGAGFPLRADTLVVGVVTNNTDPDKLGRVRLKFPWLSDEDESNWARVATFGGGNGKSGARGSQFVPEVNDEVIAGFENGDLRRPVVLGTLYNPKTKAPAWLDDNGAVASRSITSRLGHVLEFGDGNKPAASFIRLNLSSGKAELLLSDERIALKAPGGQEVEMTAGDTTVKFDKQGGILLKGTKIVIDGQSVEIKAQSSLKVEAATAEVKSKGPTKIEGAILDVKGSGMVKIAGGQVMIN